jgi:hypothetical protein
VGLIGYRPNSSIPKDNPIIPRIQINNPEGERIEKAWKQPGPEYTPPSRERLTAVVRACEASIDPENLGEYESPMGSLLRAASKALYQDASTNITKGIFPQALLAEVLTQARVLSSLSFDFPTTRNYSPGSSIERICGDTKSNELGPFARVFTILLLCDRPQDIFFFFKNDLGDKDFPFEVKDRKICSRAWNTVDDRALQFRWTGMQLESFECLQWNVFLPFFSDSEELYHQNFEVNTIMP